jgi:hypothetical protein
VDKYRVNLFKKKIRGLVPTIEKVRFLFSIGGTHLIFEHERYTDPEYVRKIFSEALNREQIEFQLLCPWPKWFPKHTYFSIPIDQDALPERAARQKTNKKARSYHRA